MDETPLFVNIPNSKTIARIDSEEVNIKTYVQESTNVTIVLWIVTYDTKLSEC